LPSVSTGSEGSADLRRLPLDDLPQVWNSAGTSRRARHRLSGLAASLLLVSCTSAPPQKPSSGTAYAGPSSVNLREDLGPRANTVGTVEHGEKLDVLEMRRRFVRVRTSKGLEGWTDANYLLSQQQVSDLDRLAEYAAKLPSQGSGSTYDSLNVHVGPSRQSPSFTQIPEGGVVEVLQHRVSPRSTPTPPAPPKAKSKGKQANAKAKAPAPVKGAKKGDVPPPALPPPPPVPANLAELSRPRAGDLEGAGKEAAEAVAAPRPPADDWYLVRTRDRKAGWVLARQISMSIPDEVAQYAEGRVITGYLSLGKDEKAGKDNWLWTTRAAGVQDYDFDSFRVFVWSTKRSRYETAYIERNVRGRFPIEAQGSSGDGIAFSVVLEDKDGQVYKRTYAFSGYRVKMVAKASYQTPPAPPEVRTTQTFEEAAAAPEPGWSEKLRDMRKRLFKR
jgi:hypothetical protein